MILVSRRDALCVYHVFLSCFRQSRCLVCLFESFSLRHHALRFFASTGFFASTEVISDIISAESLFFFIFASGQRQRQRDLWVQQSWQKRNKYHYKVQNDMKQDLLVKDPQECLLAAEGVSLFLPENAWRDEEEHSLLCLQGYSAKWKVSQDDLLDEDSSLHPWCSLMATTSSWCIYFVFKKWMSKKSLSLYCPRISNDQKKTFVKKKASLTWFCMKITQRKVDEKAIKGILSWER